jgi:hypothetical protein
MAEQVLINAPHYYNDSKWQWKIIKERTATICG